MSGGVEGIMHSSIFRVTFSLNISSCIYEYKHYYIFLFLFVCLGQTDYFIPISWKYLKCVEFLASRLITPKMYAFVSVSNMWNYVKQESIPVGCVPPACQLYMFRRPPLIVDRILDTRYWKYYLAPTSLRAVNMWKYCRWRSKYNEARFVPCAWHKLMTSCPVVEISSCPFLW